MHSFIYMLIALIVAFIISRIMKDSRIFTRLCLVIFVSFVLGTFVKDTFVRANGVKTPVAIENVTSPMLHLSEAMSTANDTLNVTSKDTLVSDTVSIAPAKPINKSYHPEIVNDS